MADLDNDKQELLERRLADKVIERVRPALFRLYATAGLAVIGVLGFVSWDIVSDIKNEIKSEIDEEIAEEIKSKRDEILELVTETRVVAKRANKVIQRVEEQLHRFEPRAENLDETVQKVESLNINSQNFLAIYEQELKPVVSTVASLSKQLKVLAEQVNELNQISPTEREGSSTEPGIAPQQRAIAIQSVISEVEGATQSIVEARKRTTVFFQFAGGLREQAQELAVALKSLDYNIPGEDREVGAANKHEVRYFHDEDRSAAENLAKDTTDILRSQGYGEGTLTDVVATSFVSYRGKKPRAGVLELWLEIPLRKAWADTSPTEAYCYHEDRQVNGPERFSVHCHSSRERCETARGPNPRYKQSGCVLLNLAQAGWAPGKGYLGSLYQFRSEPFGDPFPPIP